jgi:hypothetical protein
MSSKAPYYKIFNNRDQPVELHYGQQVVVVPPWGQVELEEAVVASRQVQALQSRGFISVDKIKRVIPGRERAEAAINQPEEALPPASTESLPKTPDKSSAKKK